MVRPRPYERSLSRSHGLRHVADKISNGEESSCKRMRAWRGGFDRTISGVGGPREASERGGKARNGAGIRIEREGIAKGEEAQERMQDRRGGGEARLITGQCPFLQPGNISGPTNATCAAPTPQLDGKETERRRTLSDG
jgi:hypothetical protein